MKIDDNKFGEIAQKWVENLKKKGYEHYLEKINCRRLKKFSRLWRKIFRHINLNPYNRKDLSVFEVGCGGGKHLAQFTLNGWKCGGIDCSKDVLDRANIYFQKVSNICRRKLDVELIYGDFLYYKDNVENMYDIVFQVGVLEHFLNQDERMLFLKKMYSMTKFGGCIIQVVPNGMHPLRTRMKDNKLGGYNIPEIDYTPNILYEEMKQIGGKDILVLGHNIFTYLVFEKDFLFVFKKIIYLFWQVLSIFSLPSKFVFKHAGVLIAIGKK